MEWFWFITWALILIVEYRLEKTLRAIAHNTFIARKLAELEQEKDPGRRDGLRNDINFALKS
jgi:hypothetical protein